MKEKTKNLLIAASVFSALILIAGIILLVSACHGECGSDIHGRLMTFVCPKFYFPLVGCIVMIVIGAVGMISAAFFLIFGTKSKPH